MMLYDQPALGKDYLARLDGAGSRLWEPLWQIQTDLQPVERELLLCPVLRRLHFIHHAGPAYLTTPHSYSRYQHTLGVFALIAHFCPGDFLLRVAALLHDVGHAPFSHALEQLPHVDHHRWTIERVLTAPVADILTRHGLDPQAVLAAIEGEPANPLRNQDNILHLDHLDSWVRSAQVGGILPVLAPQIAVRLAVPGSYLEMNVEIAQLLVTLIVAEAHFHCSPANLGPNTILRHLVEQALASGDLSVETLAVMTDAQVERVLRQTPATAAETRRLWNEPHRIIVNRLEDGAVPPGAHLVSMDRLYLAVPRTNGQPVTEVSPQAARLMAEARQLAGTYVVSWADL